MTIQLQTTSTPCRALYNGQPCTRPAATHGELCDRCARLKDEVDQRYVRRPLYREEAERLFALGYKPRALTPEELAAATERAQGSRLGFNPVVKQPEDNVYGDGRFKVLERTDGLVTVYDSEAWPPNGPVYRNEVDARVAVMELMKS